MTLSAILFSYARRKTTGALTKRYLHWKCHCHFFQ